MTQEESVELIEWIEAATHRAATKALKRYARGAIAGFLFLFIALILVRHDDKARADRAVDARVKVAQQQREAIVKSGSAVAVEGCNQRFKDRVEIRAVLVASKAETKVAYKAGDISAARYKRSLKFYDERLRGLPLPDCRKSVNVLTTDINAVPEAPKPLHPK